MSEERWIRVEAPAELQPGMTLRIAGCNYCASTHVFMLLRPEPHFDGHVDGSERGPLCDRSWATTQLCRDAPQPPPAISCFHSAIGQGRLARLDVGDLSKTAEERLDDILAKQRACGVGAGHARVTR